MKFLAKAIMWILQRVLSLLMPLARAFLAFMLGADRHVPAPARPRPAAGRIIEIDPKTNDIVWEGFNVVERGERKDLIGRVTRAFRFDADYPTFPGENCPAVQ